MKKTINKELRYKNVLISFDKLRFTKTAIYTYFNGSMICYIPYFNQGIKFTKKSEQLTSITYYFYVLEVR